MRNNYFIKLIKYINNVYHMDKKIEHVTDKRVNLTFKTSQIVTIVLMGFLLRIISFNQLNLMIKTGEFDNIFAARDRMPKIDTIRNSLKSVDLKSLRIMNQSIIKKACRNKVLDNGTIDGYNVVAIDGTSLFKTKKTYCNDCLYTIKGERSITHTVVL